MKEIANIQNHTVEIKRRARQRSMVLRVKPDGFLTVTCNKRASQREILKFILASSDFIEKQKAKYAGLREEFPLKKFESGEKLWFFGRELPLSMVYGWAARVKIEVQEDAIEIVAPLSANREAVAKAVRAFYKKQAKLHLGERLYMYSKRMGLSFEAFSVRGQTTRWGSCSSLGVINLNWKLLAAPVEVIDYVVVHELAHLAHMDHSNRFWDLVGQHHPDWRAARDWLRKNEFMISTQFK